MGRALQLFVILLFASFPLSASHIVGGEIGYKHLNDFSYELNLAVYRDCNSCKFNGQGGGNSQENCDDIDRIIVRAKKTTETEFTNVGLVYVNRVQIKKALTLCSSEKNACDPTNGATYGVEQHLFKGSIDLSAWYAKGYCDFEFHVQVASRGDNLSNGLSGKTLDIFAALNLCQVNQNSSVEFVNVPQFYAFCDIPFIESWSATDADGDSISYHLVPALIDFDVTANYINGYAYDQPVIPFCPVPDCTPNPNAHPPEGFYFNNQTGQMVFTPVGCGRRSTLTVEAREWRKLGGQMRLVGKIRRDFEVQILKSNLSSLQVSFPEQITYCQGELKKDTFEIGGLTSDISLQVYPQVKGMSISLDQQNKRAILTYKNNGEALPNLLRFNFKGDNCPIPVNFQITVPVKVNRPVLPLVKLTAGFCEQVNIDFLNHQDFVGKDVALELANAHTTRVVKLSAIQSYIELPGKEDYKLTYIIKGKECTWTMDGGNIAVPDRSVSLTLSGITSVCPFDLNAYKIKWTAPNGELKEASIWSNRDTISGLSGDFNFEAHSFIYAKVSIEKDGQICGLMDSLPINVQPIPYANVPTFDPVCFGTTPVDLTKISVEPTDGQWVSAEHNLIQNQHLQTDLNKSRFITDSFNVYYLVKDNSTGCVNPVKRVFKVYGYPKLQINPIVSCDEVGTVDLKSLIHRPIDVTVLNFNWSFPTDPTRLIKNIKGEDSALYLTGLTAGRYPLYIQSENVAGCISLDTTHVEILDDITTKFKLNPSLICATQRSVDLVEILKPEPAGGVWASSAPIVNDSLQLKDNCGPVNIQYIYNKFGCYSEVSTAVNVVCQPELNRVVPDTFCMNSEPFNLPSLTNENWEGELVNAQNQLVTQKGSSGVYEIQLEHSLSGCVFTKKYPITILETPSFDAFVMPEKLCEGEELNIHFTYNSIKKPTASLPATFKIKQYQENEENRFHLLATTGNSTGLFDVNFRVEMPDQCPHFTYNRSVEIQAIPKLSGMDEEIGGCAPYAFQPNIQLENFKQKDVSVLWTYGDSTSASNTSNRLWNIHTYTSPGVYDLNLVVQTKNGCKTEENYPEYVRVYAKPKAAFDLSPGDHLPVSNTEVTFVNKSVPEQNVTFHWDFGTGISAHQSTAVNPRFKFPTDTGAYKVTLKVANKYGCFDTYTQTITIGPDIQMYIPNAFNPGKSVSEENRTFSVVGVNVEKYHIVILNRWGQKVYESDDINGGWDGRSSGELCESGVFVYQIKCFSKSGQEYDYQGTLNLLR